MESTDPTVTSHSDVRIKETDNAGALDRKSSQKCDSPSAGKTKKDPSKKSNSSGGLHASSQKRRNFCRSQSVTAPKSATPKPETTFSYSKQSSFSTMSDADLENWKLSMLDPAVSRSSETSQQEQPVLTVAGSLPDNSNVTVGFDVKEKEKK